jgi:preprotein translocase subunit SecA
MNYLQEMDYLKAGIGLRGYGQRDPLVEYKEEAYRAFGYLVGSMYEDFLRTVLRLELAKAPASAAAAPSPFGAMHLSGPAEVDGDGGASALRAAAANARAAAARRKAAAAAQDPNQPPTRPYVAADSDPYAGVGRNDKCPCGSGKKFKDCHGRNA